MQAREGRLHKPNAALIASSPPCSLSSHDRSDHRIGLASALIWKEAPPAALVHHVLLDRLLHFVELLH